MKSVRDIWFTAPVGRSILLSHSLQMGWPSIFVDSSRGVGLPQIGQSFLLLLNNPIVILLFLYICPMGQKKEHLVKGGQRVPTLPPPEKPPPPPREAKPPLPPLRAA